MVQEFKLFGFSESDWAGSFDDMKSALEYCFRPVQVSFSCCSKKQKVISQTTEEAEFLAAILTLNQAIWLRNILADLELKHEQSTQVFVNNQTTVSISHNLVFHGKAKHISVKLFYLREV